MKLTEILNNVKVEWKKLGEVCEIVTDYVAAGSFKTISDNVKYLNKPDYAQLIRTKDIKSKFQNLDTFVYVDKKAFNFLYRVNLNTECLILPNIGNCGEIYYIKPETLPYKNNVLGPNAIFVKSKSENNKFLYYLFLSIYFQKELYKITSKTGQGKFNKTELKKILIPIPPLEIQEKIAKILDKFTNYATELRTELRLRNKQYEYYRNLLLSKDYLKKLCLKFGENSELKTATLGEVCDTRVGYTPSKRNKEYWENGCVDWFTIADIRDRGKILDFANVKISKNAIRGKSFQKNSIILSIIATIGEYALIRTNFVVNQQFMVFTLNQKYKEKINMEFMNYFFYFVSLECQKYKRISNVPTTDTDKLLNFQIPIPPLKVQNEVVVILDKFSDISSNLEKGLPKEIDLRQKQYEFYRDLLLNFKNIDEKIR